MESPTIDESQRLFNNKPQRCTVIEVNRVNLWYLVEFENGIRETYKMPKHRTKGGIYI